jgi:cell wall assembly regulator SMI1
MEEILESCEKTILELNKFAKEICFLGEPIKDNRLDVFEKRTGFKLPLDFKYLISRFNGFSLNGTEVYGIDISLKESSFDNVYEFEHFKSKFKMPLHLIPFSPDGRGNHYCLDLSGLNNGICNIKFWQSDFNYNNFDEIENCNTSFLDWVDEVMISWTLEDLNYDGSEKNQVED